MATFAAPASAAAHVQIEHGLAEVMTGEVAAADAIVADHVEGLWLLPVKSSTAPTDLFELSRVRAVLDDLRDHFDYILIDTPPVLGVTDARNLARRRWGGDDQMGHAHRRRRRRTGSAGTGQQNLRSSGRCSPW
jgi:hypothetical protein